MDPAQNPFTPNAGAEPEVIAGRNEELASFELLLRRLASGRTEQSMIITGLRGVGKTVLLGKFREKALAQRWVVVELEVSKHDDSQFRRELATRLRTALFEISPKAHWSDRLTRAASVLKSFALTVEPNSGAVTAGLDVGAAEGFGDHGDLALDLTDVLLALGEAAASVQTGVVLLLDEIQFLTPAQLEALIEALHKAVQRKVPVTLVGAGLPQIAELAGDAKSYAERLFRFPVIGHLSGDDARQAFEQPAAVEGVAFEPDALDLAIAITSGYPYFVQELGAAAWPLASDQRITVSDISNAVNAYESKLDSSFFRVRLDRTTELQRAYLRAMASLGPEPQKAADVAEALGRTSSSQVGPVRAQLIDMGLLYTPQHGYAAFTVPHFDKFMLRAVPELVIPEARSRRPSERKR